MNYKEVILSNICYTELVYGRINKKLNSKYSTQEIEELLPSIIEKTELTNFIRKGKNIYVYNEEDNLRITININTFRVITVDKLNQ
ncbi:DUF3781 domain-containing protein [Tenacibaculum sp. M341]|uniref:DUF3781 domain-containing protein n=1 Tax=Tenacibaculum sp. M341 TaxID=2530339 RepID=UPI00104D03FB|nr:DUF3781 domain-containing protein [Tenacibaculum sp. M341]TCI92147.1 DUF3781 domain-containing protein [Tenacibaculum sp. M341]